MNKDRWEEWICKELRRDSLGAASEEFYRGVWRRIKAAEKTPSAYRLGKSPITMELACWRAVPVLSALVLVAALFVWFYPPDFGANITNPAEAYVLDEDTAPSNSDLFYQIMYNTHISGLEAEP